jgi:hypothetical protein
MTDGMLWNLNANGSMKEDFWVDKDAAYLGYYGMIFDVFNFSHTLYISVRGMPSNGKVHKKKIDENGESSSKWSEVKFEANTTTKYSAMFDINANLYDVGLFGDIYHLIGNDENKIIQTKEVSFAHKFFNLYSSLNTQFSIIKL